MIAFKWYVTVISTAALLAGCLSTEKKRKFNKNSDEIGMKQNKNSSNIDERRKQSKNIAESGENEHIESYLHEGYENHSLDDSHTYGSENNRGSAIINFPFSIKSLTSPSFDFLLPLNKDDDRLVFSQIGARRHDGRNIINFGIGQRHFFEHWMLGYNSFYDAQISGNQHQRLSVGLELWKDYLKFSTNSYHRISGWKPSAYLTQSDERVANGYDLRLEAALPNYPQIAGKLKYEHYFGHQVATTSRHERYDNPSAFTLGMSYTPVPLVSLGFDHSRWNNGNTDTKLNLSFNYQINVPLSKQLDSRTMPQFRTLSAHRLDLVDRNHTIVLEHRDKETRDDIKLTIPAEFRGFEGERKQVHLSVTSKYEIDHIQWNASDLLSRGGKIIKNATLDYQIQLPQFDSQGINQFIILATAYDKKGNTSNRSQMTIYTEHYNPVQPDKIDSPSLTPLDDLTKRDQIQDSVDILIDQKCDDNKLDHDKNDTYDISLDESSIESDDSVDKLSDDEHEEHLYDSVAESSSDSDHNLSSNEEVDGYHTPSDESTVDNDYSFNDKFNDVKDVFPTSPLSSPFTPEDKETLNNTLKNMSNETQDILADKLREVLKEKSKTNIEDDVKVDHGFDETFNENPNVNLDLEPLLLPPSTTEQQVKLTDTPKNIPEAKRSMMNFDLGEEFMRKRKAMGLDKHDDSPDETAKEKKDTHSTSEPLQPLQVTTEQQEKLTDIHKDIQEDERSNINGNFNEYLKKRRVNMGIVNSDVSSDETGNNEWDSYSKPSPSSYLTPEPTSS